MYGMEEVKKSMELMQDKKTYLRRRYEAQKKIVGDGDCEVCNGTGIIWEMPPEDEIDKYGDILCCSCKSCKGTGYKAARIDDLESFRADTEFQKKFKGKALSYLLESDKWFFAGGQVGSGKTHICRGITRKLNGYEFYWNIDRDKVKGIEANVDLLERIKNEKILYIDDLLSGTVTEADIKLARLIIDYRYNHKLRTIISSEKNYVELNQADEGLAGRIREMCGGKYEVNIQRDKENNYRNRR